MPAVFTVIKFGSRQLMHAAPARSWELCVVPNGVYEMYRCYSVLSLFHNAGVATKQHFFDKTAPGTMGGTYGGNAVACAAAVATIQVSLGCISCTPVQESDLLAYTLDSILQLCSCHALRCMLHPNPQPRHS